MFKGVAGAGSQKADEHRKGVVLTAVGGLLYTFDVPLLRLAHTDPSTLIFVRGILLPVAITLLWMGLNRYRGTKTPFIDGMAGVTVAITSALTNIIFLTAVTKTTAANLVFILALNPVFCAVLA